MPARDSDDDIHKYMPDFKTILRTADPAVAAEKRRTALDAPDVVEVIAELREDNEVTLPVGVAPRAAAASASPWAAAEGEINKAALPSSLAPNAAPPVVRDAADAKPKRAETAKKKFPAWAASVAAVVAVAGPVTFAVILLSRPPQNGAATVPSATALAVPGSAAAPAVTSAAPLATQAPSVQSAAPVPSVSAVAPPAAVPTPPEPARPKLGRHDRDPYDAALPKPAKTVEPAAQPVPTQQPTAVPAPGKSPVEGDRVFGN